MNCIINTYERGFKIMGKKSKKDKAKKSINETANMENTKSQSRLNVMKILEIILVSIIIPFLGFIGKCIWDLHTNLSTLDVKVSSIQKTIESISTIEKELETLKEKNNSFESDLNAFKNTQDTSVVYVPTNITLKTLSTATINNGTEFLSTPSWNDSDVIAKNPRTGRKYKAKSLRDKKILIPYKENGQDIYFFGQFNKYNHWDGDCIINVYSNNKLLMIMEGRYDNGALISYKQVNHFKNASDTEVWGISERKVKENVNVGETFTYYKTKNKKSNFTQKNVEASDILSVLDFEDWLNTPLEGYYHGNTSNGSYNDDTGKSYLIKYNKDGTVRTLYYGNFKDGKFEDDTNNAWYIALDKENSTYVYYKGKFGNNIPLETSKNKRRNISNKEINKIIDGMDFKSSVKLYNDNNL